MTSDSYFAEDERIAREALASGDLGHAAQHIGALLALEPPPPVGRELAQRLIDAHADADRLLPAERGLFHGAAALRALLLVHADRLQEAASLAIRADSLAPKQRYLELVAGDDPSALAARIDATEIARTAQGAMSEGHCSRALCDLLLAVHDRWPHDEQGIVAAARALRLVGEAPRAVALAERAHARTSTYWICIALAMARSDAGDEAGACRAFREALEHDPDDIYVRLDLGDRAIAARDWEGAIEQYREVLAREPAQEWALASLPYVRLRLGGDRSNLAALRELAEAGNQRATALYSECAPYELSLAPPGSSVVNGALHARTIKDGISEMAVSSLEPPSAILAAHRILHARDRLRITTQIEGVGPDPRVPRSEVASPTWTYLGAGLFARLRPLTTDARPALEPPSATTASTVAEIAASTYGRSGWWSAAKALGRRLGPRAARDLIATMVHPPARADGDDDHFWVFSVQVAAAMALAGIDDGWIGSKRRPALLSLVDGPVDWCSTAGILALVEVAREDEQARSSILGHLVPLLDVPISPIWYGCIHEPLVHRLSTLEGLDPALERDLARRRAALDE